MINLPSLHLLVLPGLRGSQSPRGPPRSAGVVGTVVRAHCLHLHLLRHLLSLLLHDLLHGFEPVLPQLYSFVCVAHTGVFHHGSKHHEETDKQIDVDGLHVGYLGQGGVDGVDEGGHGEHSGHPQSYSGWSCSSVEPEGDPGHHHYETARNVNLEGNNIQFPVFLSCLFNTGLII